MLSKIIITFFTIFIMSCSSVSITERKQLIILGDNVIYPQAFKAYENFKKNNKLIKNGKDLENIKNVTNQIKSAIKKYYKENNRIDPTGNFSWEVILVDDKDTKNAWCMPGGKMAVYSGILEIADDNDSIAALMGHEIAHAVARHGSERASQGMLLDIGTMALERFILGKPLAGDGQRLYQYFTTIGFMLPFSRSHEIEADYLGLVFMHFAGYNMEAAYKMWEKMEKLNSGKSGPEFLSTHPSSKNRIKKIKTWIPEIKKKFNLIQVY